jgi:hypothetical protein
MAKKNREEEPFVCPVGRFFMDLDKVWGSRSQFHKHLDQSRIEFLKALRSLMDERIDTLEKRQSGKDKKKATKIEVE